MVALGLTLTAAAILIQIYMGWPAFVTARKPRRIGKLPRVRWWRPKHFQYGLQLVKEYAGLVGRYQPPPDLHDDRCFAADELVRWSYQALLSCAAVIVPHSQGKANLFRVTNVVRNAERMDYLHIGSFECVGIFPPAQLTDDDRRYREFRSDRHELPVALKTVELKRPILQPLTKDSINDDEKRLGTTHILGVPLAASLEDLERGAVVSITVDCRIGPVRKWLYKSDFVLGRSHVIRRAKSLQSVAVELQESLLDAGIGA